MKLRLPLCAALVAAPAAAPLSAWAPRLHEAATVKAVRMVPRRLSLLLRAHPQILLEAARGQANDQPATAADVESEFLAALVHRRCFESRRGLQDPSARMPSWNTQAGRTRLQNIALFS